MKPQVQAEKADSRRHLILFTVVIGVLVVVLVALAFRAVNRYYLVTVGDGVVYKVDKLTGRTWVGKSGRFIEVEELGGEPREPQNIIGKSRTLKFKYPSEDMVEAEVVRPYYEYEYDYTTGRTSKKVGKLEVKISNQQPGYVLKFVHVVVYGYIDGQEVFQINKKYDTLDLDPGWSTTRTINTSGKKNSQWPKGTAFKAVVYKAEWTKEEGYAVGGS